MAPGMSRKHVIGIRSLPTGTPALLKPTPSLRVIIAIAPAPMLDGEDLASQTLPQSGQKHGGTGGSGTGLARLAPRTISSGRPAKLIAKLIATLIPGVDIPLDTHAPPPHREDPQPP